MNKCLSLVKLMCELFRVKLFKTTHSYLLVLAAISSISLGTSPALGFNPGTVARILRDVLPHADGATKIGMNGMSSKTFHKQIETLLDAGKNDEAIELAREFGGGGLVWGIKSTIRLKEHAARFVEAVKTHDLFQAENIRDTVLAATPFSHLGNKMTKFIDASFSHLGNEMTKFIDASWDKWSKQIDAVIERADKDSVEPANLQLSKTLTLPLQPKNPHLTNDALRLLKSFDNVSPIRKIRFVRTKVKQFVSDFKKGACEPEEALRLAEQHNHEIVKAWKSTPREKRIFIAGAGEDTPQIIKIKSKLEADGYAIFFYKFCVEPSGRLCPSPMVGAFFKTSGHAMLFDSIAVTSSRYVLAEVATAQRIASNKSHLILITPMQVLAVATGVTIVSTTAVLVTFTIVGDD